MDDRRVRSQRHLRADASFARSGSPRRRARPAEAPQTRLSRPPPATGGDTCSSRLPGAARLVPDVRDDHRAGPATQPEEHQPRAASTTSSSSSPGCPVRASRAWRSTRSTPRVNAATSSRSPRMPASSSARWTSPTSSSSRVCRRRSPSTRSRRRATPDPRSARSPRSTTTCVCCSPASVIRTARCRRPARAPRPRSRSSIASAIGRGHPLPGAGSGRARSEG